MFSFKSTELQKQPQQEDVFLKIISKTGRLTNIFCARPFKDIMQAPQKLTIRTWEKFPSHDQNKSPEKAKISYFIMLITDQTP